LAIAIAKNEQCHVQHVLLDYTYRIYVQ